MNMANSAARAFETFNMVKAITSQICIHIFISVVQMDNFQGELTVMLCLAI